MQSLEKRIAELEKSASIVEWPMTIVITFLAPRELEREIQGLRDQKGGQRWMREPGETEQGLIDRASREVTRHGQGCALLMAATEP